MQLRFLSPSIRQEKVLRLLWPISARCREAILADRAGQFVDIDAALDQTRDERIDEITALR